MNERLYSLLPAVYRKRDSLAGEPLRAFMAILERELDLAWSDTATTYDNWFIETCEEWLVAYIGEQVGVTNLPTLRGNSASQRPFIANALALRQRKGTALAVEQLARDLTGYASVAVEYFRHVAVNAHVQHVRPRRIRAGLTGTVDLRDTANLLRAGTAFDPFPHTPDVRRVDSNRGRFNLMNVGLHLWRTRRGELSLATATRAVGEVARYHFEPFGHNLPLFPILGADEDGRTTQDEAPEPLSLYRLYLETEPGARRVHLDPANPAFVVRPVAAGIIGPPYTIEICHLGDTTWAARRPPNDATVAVDPERGRLALTLAEGARVSEVLVDFQHGYTAAIGAGGFDRTASMNTQLQNRSFVFRRAVSRDALLATNTDTVATLELAITAWNAEVAAVPAADRAGFVGLIAVLGSRTYAPPATPISLPDGARLYLWAAPDPQPALPGDPVVVPWPPRSDRVRPVIAGDLSVSGTGGTADAEAGGLFVNGLLILGQIHVLPGDLAALDLAHTTLAPEDAITDGAANSGRIDVRATAGNGNTALEIRLSRSITGAIESAGPISSLAIEHSVVHADAAIALEGAALDVHSSTILGSIEAGQLEASDSIFFGHVEIERTQTGCVRFSFVREGSRSPRRFRCQPDIAIEDATTPAEEDRARATMRPAFVSLRAGHPAYARLTATTPDGIARGAEDASEMGAHHHLEHARRTMNLRLALREYLRFGLDAGLISEG